MLLITCRHYLTVTRYTLFICVYGLRIGLFMSYLYDLFFIFIFISINTNHIHCGKGIRIQSFSGPHFPPFGLNTEKYGVSLRIQSDYGKIRTRRTPNSDTFHVVIISLKQAHLFFGTFWSKVQPQGVA